MIQTSTQKKKTPVKISKYVEWEIGFRRMWKLRTKIAPVIIGALGTIKKGLDQKFQLLPGHPSAIELNEHCARSISARGNRFDLLLRSGLTTRPLPNN